MTTFVKSNIVADPTIQYNKNTISELTENRLVLCASPKQTNWTFKVK